jgi:CheY-like chemotaxis protein/anti-sigma regulatory factor (Ser/Thr protein kinase)
MNANPTALAGHTDPEPATSEPPVTVTVLVVDDSPMDRHVAGAIVQKLPGWKVAFAANGVEALAAVEKDRPQLVVTDLLMPEMDGLQLVQAIHDRFPQVPVILMTAHGSEDIAIQALQKGAASYVPKKSLARDLPETLEQVLSAAQTGLKQRRILDSLTRQEFLYVIDNDTTLVAPLVNQLEEHVSRMGLVEPSGLILLGVALHEALTNAILHGNLEMDSILRESDEKLYYRQAQERRTQQPYCDRRVTVTATMTREEATFVVQDEGNGFDPALLPDPTDPANLEKVSGRGLLLIQTFMDGVEHNEKGNVITMVKRSSR